MAKKEKHAEHVNMERWLVSYADFVTLMFILFIIMFAFSQVDIEKYKKVAASLAGEFGGTTNPLMEFEGTGAGEAELESILQSENQVLVELATEIRRYSEEKGTGSNISLRTDERGLHISITGTVLYNDASATLTAESKDFIDTIFDKLMALPNNILIEGHTDNRPIRTREFPSNWELSSARSINLVRYLIEEYHFEPDRLSSAAYGEYRPVAPNDTPENRAKNRRVEIIILKTEQQQPED